MVLLKSKNSKPGGKIIPFRLKGVDEKFYSISDFQDKDILIVMFICNHCPYVKAQIERYVDFQAKFGSNGVQIVAINSNDPEYCEEDSYENMKIFARTHSLNFPYLSDETQQTAKNYDAVCTPDIFVYDKDRNLRYRGRFDDSWKDASKVKSRDLEKVVEILINNEEIEFEQIPSMGCSIKWK